MYYLTLYLINHLGGPFWSQPIHDQKVVDCLLKTLENWSSLSVTKSTETISTGLLFKNSFYLLCEILILNFIFLYYLISTCSSHRFCCSISPQSWDPYSCTDLKTANWALNVDIRGAEGCALLLPSARPSGCSAFPGMLVRERERVKELCLVFVLYIFLHIHNEWMYMFLLLTFQ